MASWLPSTFDIGVGWGGVGWVRGAAGGGQAALAPRQAAIVTTLMIRNIPKSVTQKMLIQARQPGRGDSAESLWEVPPALMWVVAQHTAGVRPCTLSVFLVFMFLCTTVCCRRSMAQFPIRRNRCTHDGGVALRVVTCCHTPCCILASFGMARCSRHTTLRLRLPHVLSLFILRMRVVRAPRVVHVVDVMMMMMKGYPSVTGGEMP